mmetsp:Transcript_2605/g.6246  ORF Transcript_2605/g.6246 Transcript_2605/m.6246 type:complete len:367 (+) Transcript_2605:288-1388(+)
MVVCLRHRLLRQDRFAPPDADAPRRRRRPVAAIPLTWVRLRNRVAQILRTPVQVQIQALGLLFGGTSTAVSPLRPIQRPGSGREEEVRRCAVVLFPLGHAVARRGGHFGDIAAARREGLVVARGRRGHSHLAVGHVAAVGHLMRWGRGAAVVAVRRLGHGLAPLLLRPPRPLLEALGALTPRPAQSLVQARKALRLEKVPAQARAASRALLPSHVKRRVLHGRVGVRGKVQVVPGYCSAVPLAQRPWRHDAQSPSVTVRPAGRTRPPLFLPATSKRLLTSKAATDARSFPRKKGVEEPKKRKENQRGDANAVFSFALPLKNRNDKRALRCGARGARGLCWRAAREGAPSVALDRSPASAPWGGTTK